MRCPASSRWEISLGPLTIWPIVFPSAGEQVLRLEDNGEAAEGVAGAEVVEVSLMPVAAVGVEINHLEIEEVAEVAEEETAVAIVEVAEVLEYLQEVESQKNKR